MAGGGWDRVLFFALFLITSYPARAVTFITGKQAPAKVTQSHLLGEQ